MKKINLQGKNIYFIGIGGVSMSGLAHILINQGYNVFGSDKQKNLSTQLLEDLGIKINYSQISNNITKNIDIVVYTAAIKDTNEEFVTAKKLGITLYSRATLLGIIIDDYKYSICVAGTHGKTTTTSMISHLLMESNINPTISVGAFFEKINGNFLIGDSEYFVVESCEYNNSFLQFRPYIGVILNLEYDHPDHFKDLTEIEHAFSLFANNVKGYLIINKHIKNYEKIVRNCSAKVITFAKEEISLPVIGQHNIENATAAVYVLHTLGIELSKKSFENYKNPKRRLEVKGVSPKGIIVIDDYAHHPTEIGYTLRAINMQYPNKKIYCVFEPHTFSRTYGLLDEFIKCFKDADVLLLLDIYGAREVSGNIDSNTLAHLIKNTTVHYLKNYENCERFILNNLTKDDLLITMGATNVNLVGERLLKM